MKKIALLVLAATFMVACQSEKKETPEEGSTEDTVLVEETPVEEVEVLVEETPQEITYQVRGQILSIEAADMDGNSMVMVSHEEIPDVMMAMKMNLKTNAKSLGEIAKDDKVSFEMVKTEEGYTMRNISKLPAETELTLVK